MVKKTVTIVGLKISYLEQGAGRPVIFVHANSCSMNFFIKQMESNLGEKYRLIALDLPGHGDSDWVDAVEGVYSVAFYTNVIAEFCRQLDCEDAVLVGNSLGGHFVLESIPLLPDLRGAIIFGAPPISNPPKMEEAFLPHPGLGLLFKEDLNNEELGLWVNMTFTASGISVPDFSAVDVRRTDPRMRSAMAACIMSLEFLDETEIARSTPFPLAILHGEHDAIVCLDYIKGLEITNIWRGGVQVIKAASHYPQCEQPKVFNMILEQYLTDIEKG